MIRPLTAPVDPLYRLPSQRTPGRYEGLLNFAMKLSGLFGSSLKEWVVLDVGGADGWLGEMLVHHRYYWVDPQVTWGEIPPVAAWRNRPIQARAEALPFITKSVDVVVSKQTLPHFEQPILACREMLRVARRAVVIRQDWGVPTTAPLFAANHACTFQPIGWPGHSRSQIDHPDDILSVLTARGVSRATYDGEDFVAWRQG